eukprot:GSA120T00021961001.1
MIILDEPATARTAYTKTSSYRAAAFSSMKNSMESNISGCGLIHCCFLCQVVVTYTFSSLEDRLSYRSSFSACGGPNLTIKMIGNETKEVLPFLYLNLCSSSCQGAAKE